MIKFVEFVSKNIKWFALGNLIVIIGLLFLPIYFEPTKNIFNSIGDLINNSDFYDEYLPGTSTKGIVLGIFFIVFPIISALISFIFRKYKIFLMFPYLTLIIITFIALYTPEHIILSIGFYLALLIFAFYLFYFIANIIVHLPKKEPKPQVPKKPTTDERISALEKELDELKNKKDE